MGTTSWIYNSQEGCRHWPVGVASPIQHRPAKSDIPTLVLAGEFDLGVPAFAVRKIPASLPEPTYEFPAAAHLQLASYTHGHDCARYIAAQFLGPAEADARRVVHFVAVAALRLHAT